MNELDIPVKEAGTGRPVLLLHGGAGPGTMFPLAQHLAQTQRVFTPTHPGWNGVPRPADISRVADLADFYLRWLRERGLEDVLVVGSSVGGWVAAEMGLRDRERRLRGVVLINAGGIDVPGEPITDISKLDPRGIAALSFHDPSKLPPQPAPTEAEISVRKANMETLHALAGTPHYMHDPALRARLGELRIPTRFIWGESDRIFNAAYGRAFAASIPGAQLTSVAQAGHLPWLEQPAATFAALDGLIAGL